MEEPRLDQFFRDKMEDFSPPPYDPTAWERLAPRMKPAIMGSSLAFWHWMSGVLGALLLLAWVYILSKPSGEREIIQQLDSLQQQITYLNSQQTQIQKDTVYVYVLNDSTSSLNPNAFTSNSPQSPLTQAQVSTIKRSANSSPPQKPSQSAREQASNSITPSSQTQIANPLPVRNSLAETDSLRELISSTPSENAGTAPLKPENPTNQSDSLALAQSSSLIEKDSVELIANANTQEHTQADSLLKLLDLNAANSSDSSRSVRQQPESKPQKERSRILQNWISAREVRAGLQFAGGGLLANNTGSGFQPVGGLYLESKLNDAWWLRTGLDVGYRSYEGENEDGNLSPDLLDALPGLVDPVTAADLKEFYMKGYSIAVPLALRREIYLNRNWDLGLQASVAAHRYLQQKFEYQSFTEDEIEYLSRDSEQQWTLSPLRLSLMAIHTNRFRPSIGLYAEYDLMQRGVEPIRFWSVGMQASFGLQLK